MFLIINTNSDGRSTIILDCGGTCIGLVSPPCLSLDTISQIGAKLQSLQSVATKTAGQQRRGFKIVLHGIQMGPGSKVDLTISNGFLDH